MEPDEQTLAVLVERFAENVLAQNRAIADGDATRGNYHARLYIDAFARLRQAGDVGRDALLQLLEHEDANVRVTTAAFLLRHRTADATAVLRAAAPGPAGLARLGAQQTLKRWQEGTWELD
jgi:aminoglycoside phosphotransferase family enzyme